MKRIIALGLSILCALCAFAQKDQDGDTLLWNGRKYVLFVDRDVPPVLDIYYQRIGEARPFSNWSNNNHRGYTATYELINEALYLKEIKAIRYKTRKGNLWTESGIDTVVKPEYLNIRPLTEELPVFDEYVATDWFSGVVELQLMPKDKKEARSEEASGHRILNVIRGKVTDNMLITDNDRVVIEKNGGKEGLHEKAEMLAIQKRYSTYHIRSKMDREKVIYNGHEGLFETRDNALTLVMELFHNDPIASPTSWNDRNESRISPLFGNWLLKNDSLFLTSIERHEGAELFKHTAIKTPMQVLTTQPEAKNIAVDNDGKVFADWLDGEYTIHYGAWEVNEYGVTTYNVAKTQKIRVRNGRVTSSVFSPSSFEEDEKALTENTFTICDSKNVWSVEDKLLAEAVGNYKKPKKGPTYKGEKATMRSWFLTHPLTDERAKSRLFRVHIAFMVNCKGEVGQWQVISKGKGELFEFANMVLDLVKTMPQNWIPATDKKGNPVDCWQKLEFTVSNGVLTNADYK